MLRLEIIRLLALDVHHANQPVLGNQRHSQLRAHLWIRGDINSRSRNVVQQNRLPRQRHLAHHAASNRHANPFRLRRVADLESHA